jgi:hypothetical protein
MIDFEALQFFFAKEKKHTICFPLKEQLGTKILQKPKIIEVEYKKPIPISPLQTLQGVEKQQENKDTFYSEWERKYRALSASNLLAQEPFKRLALFVINKKSSKEFAEKISSAVNTRLMKTIFLLSDQPLEELIKIHEPTHIITTKSVTNFIPLPGLLIDDLNRIEKSAEEKKHLWETLKTSLQG